MKQPKFKFGDKVYRKHDVPFVIEIIQNFNEAGFGYGGGSKMKEVFYWEGDLELYQEPKAKKLYAYKHNECGEIRFLDSYEIGIAREVFSIKFDRAPEYDLEYPAKVAQDSGDAHG